MNGKNKLKIAFIGWAESIHVERWVKWFASHGHEVHLISNSYKDIKGVKVHTLREAAENAANGGVGKLSKIGALWADLKFNYLSYLRYPGYIRKTRQLLRVIRPDIVQGFFVGFAGYIGAASGFHPLMVYTGGADLNIFARRFLMHKICTKLTLPRIDLLLHPSEEANSLAVSMGMAAEKSAFVHLGVDLQRFNSNIDATDFKKRLGIDGCPVVLSTRCLYDRFYNISGLLRSFALVLQKMPNARLIMKYYSGHEKGKLMQLAKELNISEKTIWVGVGDYADMPLYYNAADAFVSLSFTDSGSVSLLEAMACGCAPIVSRMKNTGEWIKDGYNGRLVEPNDQPGAAQAILDVLSDQDQRALYGKRNIEIIINRADQEKNFRKIEEYACQLVSQSKACSK